MGLELALRDPRLPSLPPIQTSGTAAKPVEGENVLPSKPGAGGHEDSAECITLKLEQPATPKQVTPRLLLCPPAPRKPRPAKRKFSPPAAGFYPVPSDLAAVFVPLPRPSIKKIRGLDYLKSTVDTGSYGSFN